MGGRTIKAHLIEYKSFKLSISSEMLGEEEILDKKESKEVNQSINRSQQGPRGHQL